MTHIRGSEARNWILSGAQNPKAWRPAQAIASLPTNTPAFYRWPKQQSSVR
jgi:hypothetical protein